MGEIGIAHRADHYTVLERLNPVSRHVSRRVFMSGRIKGHSARPSIIRYQLENVHHRGMLQSFNEDIALSVGKC